jgi:nucleoid-associated protein
MSVTCTYLGIRSDLAFFTLKRPFHKKQSNMNIHQVIIHELQKQGGRTGARLRSSNSTLDCQNQEVINLVAELNNRYKNRNENYGIFDAQNQTRFHGEFGSYIAEPHDDAFIAFTRNVSNDLREKVDTVAPAKGGYLVFAHYSDHRSFLGVFLIRDTQGVILRRNSQVRTFDIGKVEHIDFEKMAMACRINLELFNANAGRYLSFINKKSDTISKYFTSWISTTDTESNREDTLYLYKILKNQEPPLDSEGRRYDQEIFFDQVYRYINTIERQINLRDLGQKFFGDEFVLIQYAHANQIPINTEFKAHPTVLKRFIQIRVKADQIELAFSHTHYKSTVRVAGTDQVIITSESLVRAIHQQVRGDE